MRTERLQRGAQTGREEGLNLVDIALIELISQILLELHDLVILYEGNVNIGGVSEASALDTTNTKEEQD
jgi:hypothetical protein